MHMETLSPSTLSDQEATSRLKELELEILRSSFRDGESIQRQLRAQVGTLASLVFGLSLLALQKNDPSRSELLIAAWGFLGGAIAFSVAGLIVQVVQMNRESPRAITRWMQLDAVLEIRTEKLADTELITLLLTVVFLFVGIGFLTAFLIFNII